MVTSPAIQLAIECGATKLMSTVKYPSYGLLGNDAIERFYAKAQAQALRDAADEVDEIDEDFVASWLRRMAEELERGA